MVLFASVIIAWPIGNISGFVLVFWGAERCDDIFFSFSGMFS